jgi:hypothetical protein
MGRLGEPHSSKASYATFSKDLPDKVASDMFINSATNLLENYGRTVTNMMELLKGQKITHALYHAPDLVLITPVDALNAKHLSNGYERFYQQLFNRAFLLPYENEGDLRGSLDVCVLGSVIDGEPIRKAVVLENRFDFSNDISYQNALDRAAASPGMSLISKGTFTSCLVGEGLKKYGLLQFSEPYFNEYH